MVTHGKMKALLIIDMQKSFEASCDPKTIEECKALIGQAKSNKEPIILVEYKGSGSTLRQLTKLLTQYPHKHIVKKRCDDGTKEVNDYIFKKRLKINEFKVCGVNSDCCVLETSTGLARLGYQINIVKKACNTDWNPEKAWGKYPKLPNLRQL